MNMEKTFDAAEAEARLSRQWIERGAFRAGAGARRSETFSIVIPPPNVTGSLHMGHAFNNTLQDILVRWHRMRGFDTLWQPGTDHAGIATQMVVERELAKGNRRRTDMTRDEFLALVWEQKSRSRGNIIGQLQRLGCSCDWDREAFTMGGAPGDPEAGLGGGQDFHDVVIRTFVDLHERGLIYRGKRLVNWDPHFETAISDLEVENVETPGFMWHFKYPLAGGATYEYVERDAEGRELFRETRDYISIATTRPETMLGDGAVAVHPSDERYAPIVGHLCEIPVGPKAHRRLIPIITDPYPDPAFGSGAVKITGAHDFNDYAVAKRAGIPLYRLMDTEARMRDDGAPYAEAAALAARLRDGEAMSEAEVDAINLVPDHLRGLDRFEARARVVEEITAEGLAVMVPPTDPRLGAPHAPAPAPGPRPATQSDASDGSAAATEAPAQGRGVGDAPPLDASEGGAVRTDPGALVPLVEPKPIMQPRGDRSGVVIEPMLTDQWFVDAERIVGPAIEAVREGVTRIHPERDAKVYFHWLENIEPWCISRQLWWGHRIPVWYGPGLDSDGKPEIPKPGETYLMPLQSFCAPSFDAVVQLAAAHYGVSSDLDEDLVHVADASTAIEWSVRGEIPIWQDPDVLDTWFSSALWPLGTLGWTPDQAETPKYFPTSTLVTGFDILFFWVARMMMMQTAVLPGTRPLAERVPFRDVYVHALVRDEKGQKMSKSFGNVLDPIDLIDEFGADAVRFTLAAMAAMGRDLRLSTDRVRGYRSFGTKLWNACRFAQMNGARFGADRPRPQATVNRWILGETARARAEVDAALEAYRFDDAANALYRFVWGVVCDWYVEFAKPVLDGPHAEETRETMGWVLDRCMTMLHPFMPFVTEELWGLTAERGRMLVHAPWPEELVEGSVDAAAESEMRWAIALIEAVRSARAQMHVPAGLTVPLLRIECGEAGRAAYAANAPMIERLARIAPVEEAPDAPKGSVAVAVGADRFALPLAGVIDGDKERGRLEKQLVKLEKEVAGLRGRVDNPAFAASAPPEVVEQARANLAEREAEAQVVRAALARLAELA